MVLQPDILYPSVSYMMETPDGTEFIVIAHEPGDTSDIKHIEINIGKAGSKVAAWCNGVSKLLMLALEGHPLDVVIETMTDIATDRMTYTHGMLCRSGLEGVAIAMQHYQRTYIKPQTLGAKQPKE